MQAQDTPRREDDLCISRDGVLFVSGFATSLRVHRGHLVVRTGEGRAIKHGQFPRVSRPRLRRVVIYGKGGFTTWEALEWIEGIGASFALISRDGRVVASSAEAGPNQPALRRAQVAAASGDVGADIVTNLLGTKVEGQAEVLRRAFPADEAAIQVVQQAAVGLRETESLATMLALEAKAASAYWGAWREVRIRFARRDEPFVPQHWSTFGERQSPLSTSPRKAATPAAAILNYLYALAEFECRLALLAVGLDPGLGWAHRDASYRDSAALDLLEALRPSIDGHLLELLAGRTFSRKEFAELRTGQVRLMPALARSLATTLPMWRQMASSTGESIARLVARSAGGAIRVPSSATRGSRGKGRATRGRRSTEAMARPSKVPSACRECGVVLGDPDRQFCAACLPVFKDQRTEKLVVAARRVLAEMRASPDDPAQSPEAIAKRVASRERKREAARAWDRENPGPHDPEAFRAEILPGLAKATLPQMMRATGLSSKYCLQIRRGERVPHPMYWEGFQSLVSGAPQPEAISDTVVMQE